MSGAEARRVLLVTAYPIGYAIVLSLQEARSHWNGARQIEQPARRPDKV